MKIRFEYLYDTKKNETYIMAWSGMTMINNEIQSGPLNKKEKEAYEKAFNTAQYKSQAAGDSKAT